jgi:syntaxin 5
MQAPIDAQRSQAVEAIEKTLNDISGQFKRFSTIVLNHQMLVERIDSNTADALQDIESAKKELTEVYESVSSNRKLMLKIFFILLIFCTFYILFVL